MPTINASMLFTLPFRNINYVHAHLHTNAIIIVTYLINVLFTCVQVKRVNKNFVPLINELWDSGTEHSAIFFCFNINVYIIIIILESTLI